MPFKIGKFGLKKRARNGLQDSDAHANEQGTMIERPPHGTVSSFHHLDFGRPSIVERAVLPTQVQRSCASASNQADLMDITEGIEQVSAHNPPPFEFEIRAANIQALRLIRHLMATIERSDALNKCKHNKLNLLQQKIEQKDQIIFQKDVRNKFP